MGRAPDFCFVCSVGGVSLFTTTENTEKKGHLWGELWAFDSVSDIYLELS